MSSTPKFVVNRTAEIEKFEGKGGWTYLTVPEIQPDPTAPFGWVIVNGFVDKVEITKTKLQPKGDGTLFLALNAALRKKIKKEQGDSVVLKLWIDIAPVEAPQELIDCLKNEEDEVYTAFLNLPESTRRKTIARIYQSKNDEEKAARIVELIEVLYS